MFCLAPQFVAKLFESGDRFDYDFPLLTFRVCWVESFSFKLYPNFIKCFIKVKAITTRAFCQWVIINRLKKLHWTTICTAVCVCWHSLFYHALDCDFGLINSLSSTMSYAQLYNSSSCFVKWCPQKTKSPWIPFTRTKAWDWQRSHRSVEFSVCFFTCSIVFITSQSVVLYFYYTLLKMGCQLHIKCVRISYNVF